MLVKVSIRRAIEMYLAKGSSIVKMGQDQKSAFFCPFPDAGR